MYSSQRLSILEYQHTPPRIKIPPNICRRPGYSENSTPAMIVAATGSQSLEADTKEGEKYFRHQLKMLCPRIVEKIARKNPIEIGLNP